MNSEKPQNFLIRLMQTFLEHSEICSLSTLKTCKSINWRGCVYTCTHNVTWLLTYIMHLWSVHCESALKENCRWNYLYFRHSIQEMEIIFEHELFVRNYGTHFCTMFAVIFSNWMVGEPNDAFNNQMCMYGRIYGKHPDMINFWGTLIALSKTHISVNGNHNKHGIKMYGIWFNL